MLRCKTCGNDNPIYFVNGSNIGYCGECMKSDSVEEIARNICANFDDYFGAIYLTCDKCGRNIDSKEKKAFHVGRRYVYCADCIKETSQNN